MFIQNLHWNLAPFSELEISDFVTRCRKNKKCIFLFMLCLLLVRRRTITIIMNIDADKTGCNTWLWLQRRRWEENTKYSKMGNTVKLFLCSQTLFWKYKRQCSCFLLALVSVVGMKGESPMRLLSATQILTFRQHAGHWEQHKVEHYSSKILTATTAIALLEI